jgi:hypothetical protein
MASLHVTVEGRTPGQSDGNGYVVSMTQHGQRVYRPVEGHQRS